MLADYSRRPLKITRAINELVGKPFSLRERLVYRGIGSHRMKIEMSSKEIFQKLSKFEVVKFGSVELRPKGIIVHFKDNLTHWVWVIPYYKLVIYNTDYDSIHANGNFINFNKKHLKKTNLKFFKKIIGLKNAYMQLNYSGGPNDGH